MPRFDDMFANVFKEPTEHTTHRRKFGLRHDHPTTDEDESTAVSLSSHADADHMARTVARELVQLISGLQASGGTVTRDGFVRVVLTGGTAGIEVCRQLAELDSAARSTAESFPMADAIDWSRVYIFFGDERFVPEGHPDRNDEQARQALLDHVAIPPENIMRYPAQPEGQQADGPALDAAAREYETLINRHAPDGFDIHLLGMGPEGHINSLFPNTDELLHASGSVVAVRRCPKPPAERVSLTISAVNRSRRVWLLVAGAAKREAAGHVLDGDNGAQWPAALATGTLDTVLWVDRDADPTAE
ncbi:6-phosphogluconolactonase [Corynebacterium heidelbergense]|uniref:6-phosphogluconolactonase n=1 Tax=Corynebacterium heidelbergense TaxID=2055947 RepID=UPI0026CCED89